MIINGDCLEELDKLDENSVDAIVTDPPYELNFMGNGWDNAGISFNKSTWQKCLNVLKPGGYLLAFGGTRTYHRIACAIEDAGFEIRDCILWLYGSGFPKSMNIGLAVDKKLGNESKVTGVRKQSGAKFKLTQELIDNGGFNDPDRKEFEVKEAQNEWKGWGTALKPSYEPIIVARKPFKGSLVDNVMKYGVGGLNIDECRVAFNGDMWKTQKSGSSSRAYQSEETTTAGGMCTANDLGRFPANTILDTKEGEEWRRYFYCAKASKKDRDEGLEEFDGLELILCYNGDVWKENLIISVGDEAQQMEDMALSLQKAIAGFGIQEKNDIGSNILLFGKNILEQFLEDTKFITKMGISSTIKSQILNWLHRWNIKGNILGASSSVASGGSPVVSVISNNLLQIIIDEKMASALGAKPVVLKMQLRISVKEKHSTHPTVKPTSLMQYLIRLVAPKGATILDPFMGSGSTGKAVMHENKDRDANYKFIGIEKDAEYCKIAEARIKYAELKK